MSSAATMLAAELDSELPITRRVLERVPGDRLAWQPHAKSMTIGQLAEHIARIPGSIAKLAEMDGLDLAARPITYPTGEHGRDSGRVRSVRRRDQECPRDD